LIVAFVYADTFKEYNCSKHNCVIRANAINRLPNHEAYLIHITEFAKNSPETITICDKADIIVIERNLFEDALTILMFWKVRRKPIVAIFDDAYDKMLPTNVTYEFWTNGKITGINDKGETVDGEMLPKPLTQLKWGLRNCKALIVPSVRLAEDWSKYTQTYHIPNNLEIKKYENVEPLFPHNGIYIGWAGSLSHLASFVDSGLNIALSRVLQKHDNVKLLIGGDKRVFDAIDLPEDKKVFTNFVPEANWFKLLKSMDVGLAPLGDTYDERRSWIKALEYMILKIPFVASDIITYDALKPYGVFVKNSEEDWETELDKMVNNLSKYKKIASGAPYEFAKAQDIDANIEKILKVFQEIIDKPDEL